MGPENSESASSADLSTLFFVNAIISTPNSSTVDPNDIFSATNGRMTVCLSCGMFVCGTHADVSYCFSEEHMCEGLNENNISQSRQHFLKGISVLSNAMYVGNNQNGDFGLPFNQSNIERALYQILSDHEQAQNLSAINELNDDDSVIQSTAGSHVDVDDDVTHTLPPSNESVSSVYH